MDRQDTREQLMAAFGLKLKVLRLSCCQFQTFDQNDTPHSQAARWSIPCLWYALPPIIYK